MDKLLGLILLSAVALAVFSAILDCMGINPITGEPKTK
jgi:hypothetical protein